MLSTEQRGLHWVLKGQHEGNACRASGTGDFLFCHTILEQTCCTKPETRTMMTKWLLETMKTQSGKIDTNFVWIMIYHRITRFYHIICSNFHIVSPPWFPERLTFPKRHHTMQAAPVLHLGGVANNWNNLGNVAVSWRHRTHSSLTISQLVITRKLSHWFVNIKKTEFSSSVQ